MRTPAPLWREGAGAKIEAKSQNHRSSTAPVAPVQDLADAASHRATAASVRVTEPRRQRHAEHLHRLGPRPVLEALIEVEDGHHLDRVLADFARLDPEVVRDLDGDRFAPSVFAVSSS